MSIEKWLTKKKTKDEKNKREDTFKRLTSDEVQAFKKKKIRKMIQKENPQAVEVSETDKFLREIIEFKNWLNQRTYLKGDIEKIETWIANLFAKIQIETEHKAQKNGKVTKEILTEEYKKVPLNLLDEKTRIALNKRIHGTKRTNSDNYYIKKLRNNIQEKLDQAKYFKILEKILDIF